MNKKILIIDDDIDICNVLSRFLNHNGFEADVAYTASGGLSKFKEGSFDIVLTDYRLGEKSGHDVLIEIKKSRPDTIVIIITGYAHIKTAVEVVKSGAYDYISKPLIPDEVLSLLSRIEADTENTSEDDGAVKLRKPVSPGSKETYLTGCSKAAQQVYNQIEMVAPTNYSVILYGETGTGKEVIAESIHAKSNRANQPFIAVDCGAISNELAGSTLFGHVKGAFTGAIFDKEGHFESANHGTIFLDEVSNLPYETQAILLRVIQERKFKKIGGLKELDLDIRIIVASNENLLEAVRKGRFREDLYHRFNEFTVHVPALRDRGEDIPLFAGYFLGKSNEELNKNLTGFDSDVMNVFLKYSWPGNLRELRNVVRRAVLLTKSGNISMSGLPFEIVHPLEFPVNRTDGDVSSHQSNHNRTDFDLKDAASRAEYDTIMSVLRRVNFNKSKAAEILNIDRKTLYNKIKSYEDSLRNVQQ